MKDKPCISSAAAQFRNSIKRNTISSLILWKLQCHCHYHGIKVPTLYLSIPEMTLVKWRCHQATESLRCLRYRVAPVASHPVFGITLAHPLCTVSCAITAVAQPYPDAPPSMCLVIRLYFFPLPGPWKRGGG